MTSYVNVNWSFIWRTKMTITDKCVHATTDISRTIALCVGGIKMWEESQGFHTPKAFTRGCPLYTISYDFVRSSSVVCTFLYKLVKFLSVTVRHSPCQKEVWLQVTPQKRPQNAPFSRYRPLFLR